MLETQKLLSAIKPVIGFSNFFNVLIFSVGTHGIFLSKKIATLAFPWLSAIVVYKLWITSHYSFTKFSNIVFRVTDIIFFTLVILSYLNFTLHGESIVRIWNNLIKHAHFITDDSYYRKVFRIVCLQVVVVHAALFLHTATFYFCRLEDLIWQELLHMMCNYFLLTHFCGTTMLFANSLHFGRKIISLVNEELRNLRCIEHYQNISSVSKAVFVKREKTTQLRSNMKMTQNENLFSLIDVYEKICELCLDLNELSGISLTMCWMYYFLEMVLCCFVMTFINSEAIPVFFLWILYYLLFSWILLNSCEKFTKEAMKTGLLLNSLPTENSSAVLKEAVQRLSLNLLHRKVRFTACNLFDLNFKFFYSSLSSMVTYFVIFVQFS